jgi:hypothetical protein
LDAERKELSTFAGGFRVERNLTVAFVWSGFGDRFSATVVCVCHWFSAGFLRRLGGWFCAIGDWLGGWFLSRFVGAGFLRRLGGWFFLCVWSTVEGTSVMAFRAASSFPRAFVFVFVAYRRWSAGFEQYRESDCTCGSHGQKLPARDRIVAVFLGAVFFGSVRSLRQGFFVFTHGHCPELFERTMLSWGFSEQFTSVAKVAGTHKEKGRDWGGF